MLMMLMMMMMMMMMMIAAEDSLLQQRWCLQCLSFGLFRNSPGDSILLMSSWGFCPRSLKTSKIPGWMWSLPQANHHYGRCISALKIVCIQAGMLWMDGMVTFWLGEKPLHVWGWFSKIPVEGLLDTTGFWLGKGGSGGVSTTPAEALGSNSQ